MTRSRARVGTVGGMVMALLSARPSSAVDLTVTNVEVTQAVQTTTNTITLVSQRRVAVRATLGVTGSAGPVAGITGRLHVSVGGVEITPSAGIAPINAPFTAPLTPQRANENDTLNFELPAPSGISASTDVDVRVDVTPVAGETDTTNNSGAANNLTFVDRVNPLLFFTRLNYTPSGLGLPDLAAVQPGVGDLFVRGIYPFDESDPNLYRQGLFPTLTFSQDDNADNRLDGCGTEGSALLSLLASCRQLIVDSGVGASDRVFLFGWVAGNPIDGNGCGQVGGRNAYANGDPIRYQRSYAHELAHNFGEAAGHPSCAPIDQVGWDVGARLPGNPATNNVSGRVKSGLSDISCGGLLSNQAWVKTGKYNDFLSHPALQPAGGDFAERVLVVQGSFDRSGKEMLQLKPAFRYPWVSQPSPREQGNAAYAARVVDDRGNQIAVPFDATLGDDSGDEQKIFGFFEVLVAVPGEVESLRITSRDGSRDFGGMERSAIVPQLEILEPKRGATLADEGTVAWSVADADTPSSELLFEVAYSPDNGDSFVPIAVDQRDKALRFDPSQIRPTRGRGIIRVFVSDGLNSSFADVTDLTVRNACPGDCNLDRAVTIDELLKLVGISLGDLTPPTCSIGDADADGQIGIDEIVAAVVAALTNCS